MAIVNPVLVTMIATLVRRRRALGLSADELAERCGFAEKQVTKWEKGHRAPSAFLLTVWANSLGLDLAVIVSTEHKALLPLTADLFARRRSATATKSLSSSRRLVLSAA